MFALNGQASKGAEILQKYGLTKYESQAYFSLLVLGEIDATGLSKQSGVPQSKIYYTLESLQGRRLVEVTQQFPKKVVALPFEVYLHNCIEAKQKEIEELRESRRKLREVICKLQPLPLMHGDKVRIFEPSCRGGLDPSRT